MSVLDRFSLAGRAAVVTGANVGLGQGMALALAEAGADVLGISRREAEETTDLVTGTGRRYVHLKADVGDPGTPAAVVAAAKEAFGRLDILVNNAGIIRREEALEFSRDNWDAVMDVNLKGLFFLSQAAAGVMAEAGGGKIINVASMLSFQGGIRVASYTASKSGVLGLTRLLANEWAAKGINVNAIAPGYMVTDNTAALQADPVRNRQILERIPAGRWGSPDDLAGAVVFLASDASSYMQGFAIAVDGGWLSR